LTTVLVTVQYRIKRELINAAPDLIYFEVTEDEPYMDVSYLRGRLVELGVLRVGDLPMLCQTVDGKGHSGVIHAPRS